jgi:hypothetical protein
MNDVLENMWKEVVIVNFKVLLSHFPAQVERNHEKPQSE